MIRCPSCGSQNYAIDIWCSACSQHLDWAPHARNPTGIRLHRSARAGRSLSFLAPVAAALGVAIALAMPVASWFNAAGQVAAPSVAMTVLAPAAPTPTTEPTASPEVAPTAAALPTDEAGSVPEPAPTAESPATPGALPGQALDQDGDPAGVVARFYQALAAHDFEAAAALWTPVMQAQYPPAEYIDQRFAATEQLDLRAERVVGDSGGVAVVYVDVVGRPLLPGLRRGHAAESHRHRPARVPAPSTVARLEGSQDRATTPRAATPRADTPRAATPHAASAHAASARGATISQDDLDRRRGGVRPLDCAARLRAVPVEPDRCGPALACANIHDQHQQCGRDLGPGRGHPRRRVDNRFALRRQLPGRCCLLVDAEPDGRAGCGGRPVLDGRHTRRPAVRRLCLPEPRRLAFPRRRLRVTRSAEPAGRSRGDGPRTGQLRQRSRSAQPQRRGRGVPQ